MVNSSLNVQYGWITGGTCLIFLGHPALWYVSEWQAHHQLGLLLLVAVKPSLLACNCFVIWFTCSLGSLMVSFWLPKQDKQSTSWFVVPGMYLTVNI